MILDDLDLTLIGHPFAPIGMGEQLRSHIAACDAVGLHHRVLDVFRHSARTDDAHVALLGVRERRDLPGGIRVFHVNGDEVDDVVAAADTRGRFDAGYNVVMPAWELPRYPAVWVDRLRKFDEVWAMSRFVADSLAAAGIVSRVVGQSVEPEPGPLLPRRHFGIRESAFVLLHFLDLSSYATRKNPDAALDLFAELRAAHPFVDLQLVLKVKNAAASAGGWRPPSLADDPQVLTLTEPLDGLGVRSLIAACDCFVSLHRAEGFGRGLGEAMALGRLAMGTGWSGNLDFMTEANSLLVDSRPVALTPGDYPHSDGQSWAEPDIAHAARLLAPILLEPARGAARAEHGRAEVLRSHGHRAVGLRVLDQLERIAERMARPQRVPARRKTRIAAAA